MMNDGDILTALNGLPAASLDIGYGASGRHAIPPGGYTTRGE
jgi:hypothetical protein